MEGVYAATNADGFIFAVDAIGDLYVIYEKDVQQSERIRNLGYVLEDMAYDPLNDWIYGVTTDSELIRFDRLGLTVENLGAIGVTTNNLACDDQGNLYCLHIDASDEEDEGGIFGAEDPVASPSGLFDDEEPVEETDSTAALYRFTADTLDAPVRVGSTGLGMSGTQGFEWNCNDGMLYWGHYDNPYDTWWLDTYVTSVDPETAEAKEIAPMMWYAIPALIVFDKDRDTSEDATRYAKTAAAQIVSLGEERLDLYVHEAVTLTAEVLPWTVSDRSLVWSSSDPAIATVDENGKVTGISAGECTIYARSVSDGSVMDQCQVTVTAMDVTLRGVLKDTSGTSQIFTWSTQDSTWTAGAALDVDAGAVAYDAEADLLYVQDRSSKYYMHKADPLTGEILETSASGALVGVPSWDMSASTFLEQGSAVSVYASYFGAPAPIMDNTQLWGLLDMSQFMTYTTCAKYVTAVTSAGKQSVTVEETDMFGDPTGETYEQDAECFYMLDDKGFVWAIWMYEDEFGSLNASLGLYPTNMTYTLPLVIDGTYVNWSMVEDPATGALYLSYYTGNSAQLYGLYPERSSDGTILSFRAVDLGNLGQGVWPAALFEASSDAASASGKRLCEQPETATIVTADFTEITATQAAALTPGGTLNSTAASAEAQEADPAVITVQVPVPENCTNGLVKLSYDPALLELDSITANAALSSINTGTEGEIVLAYADVVGLATDSAATVQFRVRDNASGITQVLCITQERGSGIGSENEPLATDVFTYCLENGSVADAADHDCPSLRFVDLTAAWYHEAIDTALLRGIVNGVDAEHFAPDAKLTRAQFVTMLYRLAGCPEVSTEQPFEDVAAGSYYDAAVRWAYAEGYINGTDADSFSPNVSLSREMAATILWRMEGAPASGQSLETYTDADQVHGWALDAMRWAVENGVIEGTSNVTLSPTATATRAQGTVLIVRYAESFKK